MAFERAKRASSEFLDKVIFHEISTKDRDTLNEWGFSDALFVDGRQIRVGPPPSYEKIIKAIRKKVNKLNK